jgi:hypothetical protein
MRPKITLRPFSLHTTMCFQEYSSQRGSSIHAIECSVVALNNSLLKFLLIWTCTLHLVRPHPSMSSAIASNCTAKYSATARGHSEHFGDMIRRIKEQGDDSGAIAMRIFTWIRLAERPFSIVELQHALATEIGTKELDYDSIMPQATLLGCCMGLVTVDSHNATVRFVHHTLEQFFADHDEDYRHSSNPMVISQSTSGQEMITEVWLTYLMVEPHAGPHWHDAIGSWTNTEKSACKFLGEVLRSFPLFLYAARHWGNHARKSHLTGSKTNKSVLAHLLQDVRHRAVLNHLLFHHYSTPLCDPILHARQVDTVPP